MLPDVFFSETDVKRNTQPGSCIRCCVSFTPLVIGWNIVNRSHNQSENIDQWCIAKREVSSGMLVSVSVFISKKRTQNRPLGMIRSWPKLSRWLVAELRPGLSPAQHLFPVTLSTLKAHSWGRHRFLVLSCKWPFVPSSCVGSAFPYSPSDYSKSSPLKPFWPSFNPIPPPNPQRHHPQYIILNYQMDKPFFFFKGETLSQMFLSSPLTNSL